MPTTSPFGGAGAGGYTPSLPTAQQPSPKQMISDPYNLTRSLPAPSFESPFDQNGKLLSQFNTLPETENRLGGIQLNKNPLQNLESYATGTGDSPWAAAQLAALNQQTGQAQGQVGQMVQGATDSARDTLASHGGLTTGAAENLARNQQNNLVTGRQNVVGQNISGALGIRAQDAANRLGVAENLPGQEVQSTQPDLQKASIWGQAAQGTANNGLAGLGALNTFNQQLYENQIKDEAGKTEAMAMGNKGKK
jgi:hypothetical protein